MAHDVFISYSSKDKPTADAVCATLESRGVRCWIAPRDVLPGDEYAASIVNAIHSARLLVLVFSSGANQSPQVLREVERAVSRGLPILPLRIENVAPSASMEYYISSRHWLDALTEPLERHLVQLSETVKLLLSRMPAAEVTPPPIQAVKTVPPLEPSPVPAESKSSPSPFSPPATAIDEKPLQTQSAPKVAAPSIARDRDNGGRRRIATHALMMQATLGAYYVGNQLFYGDMMRRFGWSQSQVSLVSSASALAFGLGCLAGGLWMEYTPSRKVALAGGILFGAGILLAAVGTALGLAVGGWWLLLTYGLVAGMGLGLGFIASLATLLRWFPEKRGWMMGAAAASFSAGLFVVGLIFRTVASLFGFMPIFLAWGVLSLVVLPLASRGIADPPSARLPLGPSPTLPVALGRWQWYAIWALLLFNSLAGLSLLSLAIPLAREERASLAMVTSFASSFSISGIVGSLFCGWLSERMGRRWTLVPILGGQAVFFAILPGMHDLFSLTALIAVIVLCNAGVHALVPALAADCFGFTHIAAIYGAMATAWSVAALAARWILLPNPEAGTQILYLLAALLLMSVAIPWLVRPSQMNTTAANPLTSTT